MISDFMNDLIQTTSS